MSENINLTAACWHRSVRRRELFREMSELESAFRLCDRHHDPGLWSSLQERLGEVYSRIMRYYR